MTIGPSHWLTQPHIYWTPTSQALSRSQDTFFHPMTSRMKHLEERHTGCPHRTLKGPQYIAILHPVGKNWGMSEQMNKWVNKHELGMWKKMSWQGRFIRELSELNLKQWGFKIGKYRSKQKPVHRGYTVYATEGAQLEQGEQQEWYMRQNQNKMLNCSNS